ncbi:YndJ family protein [Halalkalibacter sp. APA_J-10(15)]|uniref:YndJ family protein n=1 Tax=Halalkalibacter sp. APA_J-10(15) TaxID=2933805 RepID=UPI001FF5528A|nr:YndJ family protein [Halalkalibacter sp. APA_J-10(15)]MCK0472270.1 YndJ family protein [Halalkalibacter sp. APA_J-10(15)]
MTRTIMIQAIAGLAVWLASFFIVDIGLIERLLLFSILVLVPLILYLTETKDRHGEYFKTYRIAVHLFSVGSLMAFISFFFSPGVLAGMVSVGWLLWTGIVFVYGFIRLAARGLALLEEMSIDIGLMYLLLGGGWFTLSQFGIDVMNFGSLIILLTAIHFHYSAFVTPIFLGLLGRVLRENEYMPITYRLATIGVMISPIGVAVGITYSRLVEFTFVVLFVLCLWMYTLLVIKYVRKKQAHLVGYLLISLSGLILLFTMFLAFYYGLGRLLRVDLILIPDMVTLHGIGNAFGFVLIGVLGWLIILPKMSMNIYGIPFSHITGKWKIGANFFERNQLKADSRYQGLMDDLSLFDQYDFDPHRVNDEIRQFYENPLSFKLVSKTYWHKGFRLLSKLYKWISRKMEQIDLPLHDQKEELEVNSKLIAIDPNEDGRERPRAWIRTDKESGKAVFVASYSYHTYGEKKYLNIALPLPLGQMTAVLRFENNEFEHGDDGLVLTSQPNKFGKGDEGIYYVTKWFVIRLPLDERFQLRVEDGSESILKANHRMWLCGKHFLTIDYWISRNKYE